MQKLKIIQTPAMCCPYRSIHITILHNHLSNNLMFHKQMTRIVWWPDTIKSSIVYSYELLLQLQPCTRFESKATIIRANDINPRKNLA